MNVLLYLKNVDAKSIQEEIKLAKAIIDHFLFNNVLVDDEGVIYIVEHYEAYIVELTNLLDII